MLPRRRRAFALLAFLLLATPLVAGVVAPDGDKSFLREERAPAPAPEAPTTVAAMFDFPKRLDAYLNDHFGLRDRMIRLHKDLTKPVLTQQSGIALRGASGRIYAVGDDMLMQSAGRVVRPKRLAQSVDVLADMRDDLERRGVKFLVALPPNSSTIYQDDLPSWARNPGRQTEYDLLYEALAGRGVKTVDLRPALAQARADGPTYLMNDLHWNARGALAAFNEIVDADGRPDWRIEPSAAIGPTETRKGGDIARLLGIDGEVSESTETLALTAPGTDRSLSEGVTPDHMVTTGRPGPTILVIGDSFTAADFPLFLSQHAGRAIWIHHRRCRFDWGAIDRLKPDEVWWMPVERFLPCDPDARPAGLARASERSSG
jgi:hypothetical protein